MTEGIRARLFDADGHDRAIELADEDLASIGERRLLWVDVDLDAGGTLDDVAGPLKLEDRDRRRL